MVDAVVHAERDALDAARDHVLASPRDRGTIAMIVARPAVDERVVLEHGELTPEVGLVGDGWRDRSSRRTPDGSPHPDMQLTLVNQRVLEAVAGSRDRWPLAGDQLVVDLDLSEENLPVGRRLRIGSAVGVVTDQPHTGCLKYAERYGKDALAFISTPEGREQRLRGVYVRVLEPGRVAVGDDVVVEPGTS